MNYKWLWGLGALAIFLLALLFVVVILRIADVI